MTSMPLINHLKVILKGMIRLEPKIRTLITLHHHRVVSFYTHTLAFSVSKSIRILCFPFATSLLSPLMSWILNLVSLLLLLYTITHTLVNSFVGFAAPPKAFTTTFPLPINTQFLPLTSPPSHYIFLRKKPYFQTPKGWKWNNSSQCAILWQKTL